MKRSPSGDPLYNQALVKRSKCIRRLEILTGKSGKYSSYEIDYETNIISIYVSCAAPFTTEHMVALKSLIEHSNYQVIIRLSKIPSNKLPHSGVLAFLKGLSLNEVYITPQTNVIEFALKELQGCSIQTLQIDTVIITCRIDFGYKKDAIQSIARIGHLLCGVDINKLDFKANYSLSKAPAELLSVDEALVLIDKLSNSRVNCLNLSHYNLFSRGFDGFEELMRGLNRTPIRHLIIEYCGLPSLIRNMTGSTPVDFPDIHSERDFCVQAKRKVRDKLNACLSHSHLDTITFDKVYVYGLIAGKRLEFTYGVDGSIVMTPYLLTKWYGSYTPYLSNYLGHPENPSWLINLASWMGFSKEKHEVGYAATILLNLPNDLFNYTLGFLPMMSSQKLSRYRLIADQYKNASTAKPSNS